MKDNKIVIDTDVWVTPSKLAKELKFKGSNKTQRITNWIKRGTIKFWHVPELNIILVDRTSVPDSVDNNK